MSISPEAAPGAAQDVDHLRLLAIFHYVVGGLIGLVSLFPVIHVVIGVGMLSGRMGGTDAAEARLAGLAFVIIGGLLVLAGLTLAAFTVYAGRCLARHRRYLLCLVVAALCCMVMPFGTVLGVFTLIVLLRPSVKPLFGVR